MRAYELLEELLAAFREAMPQADFQAGWRPGDAGRLPGRPVAAGQVGEGSAEGDGWSVRLDLTVYLPRGGSAKAGEELLAAMEETARARLAGLSGVQREGFGVDKATGLLAAKCFFRFAGSGRGGLVRVTIGGMERLAGGWRIRLEPGRALTAVGEDAPFAVVGAGYVVELEGLDTRGLERLAVFTAELGGLRFGRCRWKALDEAGRSAVFLSYERTEGGV